ncbi:hypothetical protein RCO27_11355 [Sphingosinicella sp. LHD-64]|uniref:DUF6894 family protein n=1 Tax=Sphingosinicella sp. LHD-64 TaxID=3072139 RepID=UPI00280F4A07|nr:hypothetical protein [Sphingosinicella sp. LHD-64]MDQ8756824.1 hypothetical protein [Sphingosinicella sp. LHD-64]
MTVVPRYYLHIQNGIGDVRDEEGVDLSGIPDARERAIEGIRSIVAEEARDGRIDLTGAIVISNATGETLLAVPFHEAFDLRLDG